MEQNENQYPKPLSVKDWLITLLLLAIPVVGIVMLFIYAFGSNENPNRQNWAKAYLIFTAIIIVIVAVIFLACGALFMSAMSHNQPTSF
ncbi:MAG TPA: hypothetical protein VK623_04315 [Flavobacterium sp.]|nr:hypothetical protein [Flavobacterium sp.]